MEEEILNKIYQDILNVNYKYDDYFKITYLSKNQYINIKNKISILEQNNFLTDSNYYKTLYSLFYIYYKNSIKRKDLINKKPRFIAQKFLSKKNIRNFIFKRDSFKCLKCGSKTKLQLYHINPISNGGENKLMNLQTLCLNCNSKKRDSYFDYRNNKKLN